MEEAQAALSIGTVVRGRYLVKSVLGAGSTGTVYLVKDQRGQEGWPALLALKEMSDLEQRTRYNFVIGGTHLLQLRHPALPRMQALFNDEKRGCVYLVMEHIEGESLADVQWNRLSWSELRAWCEPLVAALTYLHHQEQPLFHGDLKPANLVRTATGKVMLLDLGYVPRAGEKGKAGCYRAPEQFSGILNERSDVYGCGALLYTLLSGEEPIDALTRRTRVGKKKTDPLVLASKMSADVPRELAEVLRRALALDPTERFGSVREFWNALLPLLAEQEQDELLSPGATLVRSAMSSDAAQTIEAPGWGKRVSSQPGVSVRLVAGRSAPTARTPHRWLLPTVAGAVALTLLLLSAATWALGAVSSSTDRSKNTPIVSHNLTVQPGSHGGASPTATVNIPNMRGRFAGVINPLNANRFDFVLTINWQQGKNFRGSFDSPSLTGSIVGSIDEHLDLNWTLFDSAKKAFLYFYGGLNGIDTSHVNTLDNMAGSFYQCGPQSSSNCASPEGGLSGSWSLGFVPAS